MNSSFIKGIEKQHSTMISGYFINTYESSFPSPINVWIDTKDIIGTTSTMDGPLAANAEDMAKLLKAIVIENDVISHKVRQQIIGDAHLVNSWGARFYQASDFYYGLGGWKEVINGKTFYHHGGTEFGYFTQNIYVPEIDVSITALANCGVNEHCEEEFQAFTFEVLDSFLEIRKRK